MPNLPLVSVICLCYNHQDFVIASLQSVLTQTYPNIQIIIVNDGSTDKSASVIRQFLRDFPTIQFIDLQQNIGNCKAFNRALSLAQGKYIIDLATDDILLPLRIEKQVEALEKSAENVGVCYTDAHYIDAKGNVIGTHSQKLPNSKHQGFIFDKILTRQFICTPTMMTRKTVFEALGGYDERLSYEDFDFFVRSSASFEYIYLDEVFTLKRVLPHSLGTKQYQLSHNPHLISTLLIFQKALLLCKTKTDLQALSIAVRYHLRLACYTHCFDLAKDFFYFLQSFEPIRLQDWFWFYIAKFKIPLHQFYQFYFRYKHQFHV